MNNPRCKAEAKKGNKAKVKIRVNLELKLGTITEVKRAKTRYEPQSMGNAQKDDSTLNMLPGGTSFSAPRAMAEDRSPSRKRGSFQLPNNQAGSAKAHLDTTLEIGKVDSTHLLRALQIDFARL